MPRSSIFCEHANECPAVCPCDADCACKETMCQDMGFQPGVWLRQEDGFWFRVARVQPGSLTCFDHRMEILEVTPDRYRREGFVRSNHSSIGTDFSPFRHSSLVWTCRRDIISTCGVEGCGRESREVWAHQSRPSGRFEPAQRITWAVCPEHWFFPNDYQEAFGDWTEEESRFAMLEIADLRRLIEHSVQRLRAPAPEVPKAPESEPSVFDAIMDDD